MENPLSHSRVVTGESFWNRQQETKDLTYYVQNNQTVLLWILQRFGFNTGSILSRALSSLSKRDIVTKNKVYHIQNVMLKKWILRTLPA